MKSFSKAFCNNLRSDILYDYWNGNWKWTEIVKHVLIQLIFHTTVLLVLIIWLNLDLSQLDWILICNNLIESWFVKQVNLIFISLNLIRSYLMRFFLRELRHRFSEPSGPSSKVLFKKIFTLWIKQKDKI